MPLKCKIAVAVAAIVHGVVMISSPGSMPIAPTAAIRPEVQELTAIAAVDPDEAQFLASAAQTSEQETGAVAVLDRSCGDHHGQQQAHGINQDMPFRAIDLLASIVAARASESGRFDTLAIQATSGRMLVPARTLPHFGPQCVMDPLPDAILAPVPKVGVHALPFRILLRQHPPLDATDSDVQDAIDDQPHVQAAGSNIPLAVGQIGWV